jgi:hypothetical protein
MEDYQRAECIVIVDLRLTDQLHEVSTVNQLRFVEGT